MLMRMRRAGREVGTLAASALAITTSELRMAEAYCRLHLTGFQS